MPPLLVRLNLPGFNPPEPFRICDASPSLQGITRAVLEQIGGFTAEELAAVCSSPMGSSLSLLGELCAGQLVKLESDAELEVFLASADSPRSPPTIEVRMNDGPATSASPVATNGVADHCANSPTVSTDADGRQFLDDVSTSTTATSVRPAEPVGAEKDGFDCKTVAPPAGQQALRGLANSGHPRVASSVPAQLKPPRPTHSASSVGRGREGDVVREPPSPAPSSIEDATTMHTPVLHHSHHSVLDSEASLVSSYQQPVLSHRSVGPNISTAARNRAPKQQPSPIASPPVGRDKAVPIHSRLFQEGFERKKRLGEACARRQQLEQESIRDAAEKALGRSCSPGPRARSRPRTPGINTPTNSDCGTAPHHSYVSPSNVSMSMTRSRSNVEVSRRVVAPSSRNLLEVTAQNKRAASPARSSRGDASSTNSLDVRQVSPRPMTKEKAEPVAAQQYRGLPPEAVQQLQDQIDTQQTRITFLEQQHHQALRQVRKAREETSIAQRQKFEESDRALHLEELISEMQVQCGGSSQLQAQFGDWLQRSREVLESR